MYNLLKYTAWKMTPLKPYGLIHIIYFVIGLLLSLFIAYKYKDASREKLNRFILGIGLFLFVTEIYKQLFYTFYIGLGSYQWWIFPFQLCSVPIYFCLAMPFIKNEKIYHACAIFLISYNLLGGFISFLEPSGLIHEYVSLTIHAFLWHMSLVLLGLVIGLNKSVSKKKKDFKNTLLLYVVLCTVAFLINLIFYKAASGDINMFFVGPNISPIIVFTSIGAKYGWFINDILYMSSMSFGAYLFYLPFTHKNKQVF